MAAHRTGNSWMVEHVTADVTYQRHLLLPIELGFKAVIA